jgi:hypothetical protein
MATSVAVDPDDHTAALGRKASVSEAARYAGVSTSYLNKLRCVGGGPEFFKIGSRVLYDLADLDTWLERHRRRSTSGQDHGGML